MGKRFRNRQNIVGPQSFIHSSIDNPVDKPVGQGDKLVILRNIDRLA